VGIKQLISRNLRNFGLLGLFDKFRFSWQKLRFSGINRKFLREHKSVAFPPAYFIYETYRLNYPQYYLDGQETAKEIIEILRSHVNLSSNERLLDWGCGPGRVTRHLPGLTKAAIYGTDYNKKYIEWCTNNISGINFSVNEINAPLAYQDNFFKAAIGLSIFTHLSKENHHFWINELHRVIQYDGVLLITTHGYGYRHKLVGNEGKAFDEGRLVIREKIREGHRLFAAFQPKPFMESIIKGKFRIVEFREAEKDEVQDTWVLKKI